MMKTSRITISTSELTVRIILYIVLHKPAVRTWITFPGNTKFCSNSLFFLSKFFTKCMFFGD